MPAYLTDANRAAHLFGLLTEAAHACRECDERLILVVDGLDEDRGVTVGPDAHSIAALLPARPPLGLRIVVAGRLNPPLPTDVADTHPLRGSEAVRVLARSPHADVVRHDAGRELMRLLHGSSAEQDLLGLLTAAGGGLSAADLAELTGWPAWQVDEQLATVSGRTFTASAARWEPDTAVYVLGHEELQQQAVRYLAEARLDVYRQRLHVWADGYRSRRWPPGTPEYLLSGYYRLLYDLGDAARMVTLAVDLDRQHRLGVASGGDAAAIGAITTAQAVLATDDVDLPGLARLAVHRVHLAERGAAIRCGCQRSGHDSAASPSPRRSPARSQHPTNGPGRWPMWRASSPQPVTSIRRPD